MKPIRANQHLFAIDFIKEMLEGLRAGHTVTAYVWEGIHGTDAPPIEFELRVKRIGDKALPRVSRGSQ